MPGVVRCAIYTRKSTSEGLTHAFTTLDNQRQAAEDYVRSQQHEGWQVIPDRFDDGGFSGANMDRPALQKLLMDIDARKVDAVVVYKLDRLSRSLLDFLTLNRTFEDRGVTIVSVTEPINTKTPMGRAFLNILLSFGQMEREVTAERTRDKAHAARRKGRFTGGGLVLGFDGVPEGGRLVVNEVEAERVREIYELFLGSPSLVALVAELKRRRWTLKRWTTRENHEYGGGAFDPHTLRRLLSNPIYIGEVHFQGAVYPAEHPAIVERATWDRVQNLLAERLTGPRRTSTPSSHLLAGILRCLPCDAAMTPTYSGKGRVKYRYYNCGHRHRDGAAACPSGKVGATKIEKWIVDRVRAIGKDPDILARTAEETRRQLTERKGALRSEIAALQKVLDAAHATRRGQIVAAGRKTRGAGTEAPADIPATEQRLVALESELAGLNCLGLSPDGLRAAIQSFDPVWEELTQREQQRIVRLLIERIDYDGAAGKVAVTFSADGVRLLASGSGGEAIA